MLFKGTNHNTIMKQRAPSVLVIHLDSEYQTHEGILCMSLRGFSIFQFFIIGDSLSETC